MADNNHPNINVKVSGESKAENINIHVSNPPNSKQKPPTLNKEDQKNREVLIWNVQNKWIDSFLNAPLLDETPIALEKEIKFTNDTKYQPVSHEQSIMALFEETTKRSLVILGDGGSGKTTLMLELTKALLQQAKADDHAPIPLVFNLSSWQKGLVLEDWLLDQLDTVYQVSKKIRYVQQIIADKNIVVMLDALDELKQELRVDCLQAIEVFHKSCVGMVLSCRIDEYEALPKPLLSRGTIKLQPLTNTKIDNYLTTTKHNYRVLRVLLKEDLLLQELLETPLFLNMAMRTYQDLTTDEERLASQPDTANKTETIADRQAHLFDTYIMQVLAKHPSVGKRKLQNHQKYATKQTLHWLHNLAFQLDKDNNSQFLMERLQPTWLNNTYSTDDKQQVRLIRYMGFVYSIIFSILIWFVMKNIIITICVFLFYFIFNVMVVSTVHTAMEKLNLDVLSWQSWQHQLKDLFSLVLGAFIPVVLFIVWTDYKIEIWTSTLTVLVLITLISIRFKLIYFSSFRLSLFFSISFWLFILEEVWITKGMFALVFNVTCLVFGMSLVSLVSGNTIILKETNKVNQGVINNFIYALILSGMISIVSYIFLNYYAVFVFFILLPIFLQGVIYHYLLRLLLKIKGTLPLNLAPFLDYASDRIILRRMGGSYMFIHRSLLEHFAKMSEADIERLAKDVDDYKSRG